MTRGAIAQALTLGAAIMASAGLGHGAPEATLGLTSAPGVPGTIATFAGGGNGDGGPALSAALTRGDTAVDSAGDLYIGDYDRVRKVTGGTITTFAGGVPCCAPGDGGPATGAHLSPAGLALASDGSLYIADLSPSGCRVRKVTAGTITTVAGNGTCGYTGDGGLAVNASVSPGGLAFDAAGNLYISDGSVGSCNVRKVSAGIISTVAGNGNCAPSPDGGAATSASLWYPASVALDAAGNVYIAETGGCRVREVSAGTITTVAGTGTCGLGGGDGIPATSAQLAYPTDAVLDGNGNLYIADTYGCRIREVSAGIITTVAGTGACGYAGDGGPATSASLDQPGGLSIDGVGNLYFSTYGGNSCVVREVSGGTIITVAGSGSCTYGGDGDPPTSARLSAPRGIALDAAANVYIADTNNCRIREVSNGTIATIAGTGVCAYGGDGGPASDASLNYPAGVAVDRLGNVYIADTGNCRVREVSGGTISTIAGNGNCNHSGDGGSAVTAGLAYPQGIAVDGAGNIYIAGNCRVRRVSGGVISTVAGNSCTYSGDGGPATSAGLAPIGITVDSSGNLYVADAGNCRVREVSNGTISTIAGTGQCFSGGDGGPATSAYLNPSSVALDSVGNLYVADYCKVRRISNGIITTVAGSGACRYDGDGGPATDTPLNNPKGVALDSFGNLFIADTDNWRVREVFGTGDSDGDGCWDYREAGPDHRLGGDRDPLNPWDFFDVPIPISADPTANGSKNKAVTISDVLAVVAYIGTSSGAPPNANGVSYDSLKDGDWFNTNTGMFGSDGAIGADDKVGRQYDRAPSTDPSKPWRSGPPNGAVTIQDAIVALAQVGDNCN